MATQTGFCSFKISNLLDRTRIHSRTILFLLTVSLLMGVARRVEAQTPPQQHVYGAQSLSPTSSRVSGFSKASQTGALTVVPGSPFNERFEGGLVAIDGQGKFLFVLNPTSNDISMFQIDQATGALAEVPASPFQVPPTVNPNQGPSFALSIGTEASGKFVFVGYAFGDFQGQSAVVTLSIDTSVPTNPVLLTQQSTDFLVGEPLQLLTDRKGLHLYVGLREDQNLQLVGGADVYSIDSATGSLGFLGTADKSAGSGRAIAIDPAGRFFFAGWGFHEGFIDSCIISPVDGTTAALPSSAISLGPSVFPDAMVVDNSGKFLFVSQTGSGVVVYSIDQITGALSQVQGPFANISFSLGTAVADPQGPYLYSLDTLGIHAYQIDQQIGNLAEREVQFRLSQVPQQPYSQRRPTLAASPWVPAAPHRCFRLLTSAAKPSTSIPSPSRARILPVSLSPIPARRLSPPMRAAPSALLSRRLARDRCPPLSRFRTTLQAARRVSS